MAGHEAARLGSQLAASQRIRREREANVICEPRARSYDHQRQEKPEKSKYVYIFIIITIDILKIQIAKIRESQNNPTNIGIYRTSD